MAMAYFVLPGSAGQAYYTDVEGLSRLRQASGRAASGATLPPREPLFD